MITPTPQIRRALYRRLVDCLPLGEITAADVAWPNHGFEPVADRMYLAPYVLYGETRVASLSETGFERLAGVFQITVYGILNSGEAALESVAQALVELYRGGTRLPLPDRGWELLILTAYRSTLQVFSGGKIMAATAQSEISRPRIVVSANWQTYVPKGE